MKHFIFLVSFMISTLGAFGQAKPVKTLRPHEGCTSDIVYTPDGKYLITAGLDKKIQVMDAKTHQVLNTLSGYKVNQTNLVVSSDSKRLFSHGYENDLNVFNLNDAQKESTIEGREIGRCFWANANEVAWANGGKLEIRSADGQTLVKVYNNFFAKYLVHSDNGNCLIATDRSEVVVYQRDKQLLFPNGLFGNQIANHPSEAYSVGSTWNNFLIVNHSNWNCSETIFSTPKDAITNDLIFSPCGNFLFVASSDGFIYIVRSQTWEQIGCFEAHPGSYPPDKSCYEFNVFSKGVIALAFSPDGKHLLTSGDGGDLHFWDWVNLLPYKWRSIVTASRPDIYPAPEPVVTSSDGASSKGVSINVYAVVVGVSKYKNLPSQNLQFAASDAQQYARFLKSPFGGGLNDDKLVLLTDGEATNVAIRNAIINTLAKLRPGDVFIFYYSGHGVTAGTHQSLGLMAHNSTVDPTRSTSTLLMSDEITALLNEAPPCNKVLILDACYSGVFNPEGSKDAGNIQAFLIEEMSKTLESTTIIMSSSNNEQSYETTKIPGTKGHGIFSYALFEGLSGKADAGMNKDQLITVNELTAYLINRTADLAMQYEKVSQHPKVLTDAGYEFPLSFVPTNDDWKHEDKSTSVSSSKSSSSSEKKSDAQQPRGGMTLNTNRNSPTIGSIETTNQYNGWILLGN